MVNATMSFMEPSFDDAQDTRYNAAKFEQEIYKKWEKSGAFAPSGKGKPYTILMPPPNANASLHAGHAMYAVDDILVRWKRMQGYSTLWLPGMDHAGFETQFVYEKHLAKQGKSRMDFDRKSLYDNVSKFVQENSGVIYEQFQRLGFSADWNRSVFTLDDHVLNHVWETFQRMEKEGLIYKDSYIVNFCTHCGTSLAELEVIHEERVDPLYYMKYGPFTLATVRPETKFGDTAVAVHPKDKRYQKYVGREITVEGLIGKFKVKVIADEAVDPEFGTGVVKVTPAHDPNDFQMGLRHGLEVKQVIGLDGKLNEKCGKYQGLKVADARKNVAEDLQAAGLMVKVDEHYKHSVGLCYKCKRVLEPTVIPNWFIRVESLKKPVAEAVRKNKVKFYPGRFKRTMLLWLTQMHDWPISRQIAWGIRIPVWYNVHDNPDIFIGFLDAKRQFSQGRIEDLLGQYQFAEIERGLQYLRAGKDATYVVSVQKPGEYYLQETDTFDTWFSSGQWPLVTLKEHEFKTRFPTDMIGTLADILPFWISRMIMFSLYLKKEIPFKDVNLWSMVADAKGVKMSKSKGNVVNPIELVDKYGADALRMSLIFGTAPGSKIILAEDKVRAMRNFTNKIWNATRFILMKHADSVISSEVERSSPHLADDIRNAPLDSSTPSLCSIAQNDDYLNHDIEFMKKLDSVIKAVTQQLDDYRIGLAAETVYNEFWHWFCDEAIEQSKRGEVSNTTLFHGLVVFLKLLHPFVPFVTEAVWQQLKSTTSITSATGSTGLNSELLINASWPNPSSKQS